MQKITSFTIDHLKLIPGVYVSRVDYAGESPITTFDLRMTSPNDEPVMNTAETVSYTHLFLYRMQRLAALSLSHEGRMQDTFLEHQAILDTMKRGDTEHIYEVTLQHMEKPREINLEDL